MANPKAHGLRKKSAVSRSATKKLSLAASDEGRRHHPPTQHSGHVIETPDGTLEQTCEEPAP